MPRPPTVDELRAAFQRIVNEEGDPDLTCLEARHLLERRMGLPFDGLLPHKAAVVTAFQSIEAPMISLSPGEHAAQAIAFTGSGIFYYWRWSTPSGLFSWLGAVVTWYVGGQIAQRAFGFLAGFYFHRIRRPPILNNDPTLGRFASMEPISLSEEVNAHLFPLSYEARRLHRRRWLHAAAASPQARCACAIDHLVYTCANLEDGIARIEALTGVRAAYGGSHPGIGTHNALLSLGEDAYLEIIAPDTSQPPPAKPRPFGLDTHTYGQANGGGHLVAFAVHPTSGASIELVAATFALEGADPGPIRSMSRRKPDGSELRWRLTALEPAAGPRPWVIDWSGAAAHPAKTSPKGCSLVSLACYGRERHTSEMRRALKAMGLQSLGSGESVDFRGCDMFSNADDQRLHDRGFMIATLLCPNGETVTFGDNRWTGPMCMPEDVKAARERRERGVPPAVVPTAES